MADIILINENGQEEPLKNVYGIVCRAKTTEGNSLFINASSAYVEKGDMFTSADLATRGYPIINSAIAQARKSVPFGGIVKRWNLRLNIGENSSYGAISVDDSNKKFFYYGALDDGSTCLIKMEGTYNDDGEVTSHTIVEILVDGVSVIDSITDKSIIVLSTYLPADE